MRVASRLVIVLASELSVLQSGVLGDLRFRVEGFLQLSGAARGSWFVVCSWLVCLAARWLVAGG